MLNAIIINIVVFLSFIFFNSCSQPQTKASFNNPEEKTNPSLYVGKFNMYDFEDSVKAAKKNHIDREKIKFSAAYSNAAINACASLQGKLYFYPAKYYEKYVESDKSIPKVTKIVLSPGDRFLLIRSANSDIMSDDTELSPHEYAAKELERKNQIYSYMNELDFKQDDLERVLLYIQKNLSDLQSGEEETISMDEIILAAANGFFNSLDPYSSVFKKEKWEHNMKGIEENSYFGVGLVLSGGGSKDVVVEYPVEESPAFKAGIRSYDRIIKINSIELKNKSLNTVIKLIKGKKDTTVKLEIKRYGIKNILSFELKRDVVDVQTVSGRILSESSGFIYIKVLVFTKSGNSDTVSEVVNKFKELEKEAFLKKINLRGLILDFRNNKGGYVDQAVDMMDLFIKKGILIRTVTTGKNPEEAYARSKDLTDLPIAILVGPITASGAELVAGSLQSHKRAILLGDKTYGNGSIQKLMDLPQNKDYVLKITTSRYFLPSGNTTQVYGLEPDIMISSEADGTFPYSFREKDKWMHLPEIPHTAKKSSDYQVDKIQQWVQKNGKAEKEIANHKKDPIKTDYLLYRAIDAFNGYLEVEKR